MPFSFVSLNYDNNIKYIWRITNNISYRNKAEGLKYHEKKSFSIVTEKEYTLPHDPIYIELSKYYFDSYMYYYQIIPICNICIRHHYWTNNGQTSTSYKIMERLNINDFIEITDNGIIFHSKDNNYQNLNGMSCTVYY